MPISKITGDSIDTAGSGITPSGLSTGGPTWTSGGNLTITGNLITAAKGIGITSLPSGSILQVVQTSYATEVSTTSTSFVDTGLTASITPTSASSKIAVIICQALSPTSGGSSTYGSWQVLRGATQIYQDLRVNLYMQYAHGTYSCALLDSPATTSSVTYKTQMSTGNASYTIQAQHAFIRTSTIILMEVAA